MNEDTSCRPEEETQKCYYEDCIDPNMIHKDSGLHGNADDPLVRLISHVGPISESTIWNPFRICAF